jgi:hypothetical protein
MSIKVGVSNIINEYADEVQLLEKTERILSPKVMLLTL